ncbi:MAG: tetratricopeptide repeat protein [Proteobacteria bacterium]|nr:tetratricopeptide repeat protein [Pseudomonadota bacterium]MBU1738254.1 tetratricopeptide repeat protein [Pseudomonadota bacterium]
MPSVAEEPVSREFHIISVLLIIILTTLAYLNSLHGIFDFDDVAHITDNSFIRIRDLSWASLSPLFSKGPSSQRWLPMMSLAVNYRFGGYEVFGYHLVNILLHLLTSLLLYWFFRLVLRHSGLEFSERRLSEISLVAVLLWALHPLQTNVVTYVVQRMTSFAALFSIGVCICYLKGRLESRAARRGIWWGAALLLWVLALSSKENSAIIPLVLLGYDYYFLRRPGESGRTHLLALLLVAIVGGAVALKFLGSKPMVVIQAGYVKYGFSMAERLLTESRVIFYYLGLLLLPLPSRLNLSYDYPLSRSLLNPPLTLPAVAGIVLLIVLVVLLYRMGRMGRLWSFALFWYLINLVIESSVFPIEIIYEHRLYLPAMLLFLVTAAQVYSLGGKRPAVVRSGAAVLCLLLAIGTWQRNKVWASEESLWLDVVEKSPKMARGYTNLGRVYNTLGRYDKSMEVLRKGLQFDPTSGLIWLNIGFVYMKRNQFDAALSVYHNALNDQRLLGGNEFKVLSAMAYAYLMKEQPEMALAKADESLRVNPNFANTWAFKGMAHGSLGQHDKALECGQRTVALAPGIMNGYILMAKALENMGRFGEAMSALDRGFAVTGTSGGEIVTYRNYLAQKLDPSGRK